MPYPNDRGNVPSKPCPICGDMHWQKYCPLVIAAKEQHLKESNQKSHESVHVAHSTTATSGKDGIVLHLTAKENKEDNVPLKEIHVSNSVKVLSDNYILLDNQASVSVFGNVVWSNPIFRAPEGNQADDIRESDNIDLES
jgi:hypothetical protein